MLVAAMCAGAAAAMSGSAWVGLLAGIGGSLFFAAIHGVTAITFRGNQLISGEKRVAHRSPRADRRQLPVQALAFKDLDREISQPVQPPDAPPPLGAGNGSRADRIARLPESATQP